MVKTDPEEEWFRALRDLALRFEERSFEQYQERIEQLSRDLVPKLPEEHRAMALSHLRDKELYACLTRRVSGWREAIRRRYALGWASTMRRAVAMHNIHAHLARMGETDALIQVREWLDEAVNDLAVERPDLDVSGFAVGDSSDDE